MTVSNSTGRSSTPLPIPLPQVVNARQFAEITCNLCGDCCERVYSLFPPEAMRERAAAASPDDRRFYEGLEPVGERDDGWEYRCRHFHRESEERGICTIHDDRPQICRGYPFDAPVLDRPRCAWFVTVEG